MAEYLQPTSSLTISPRQAVFAVKNRMNEISETIQKKTHDDIFHCGKQEKMEHIHNLYYLNEGNPLNIEYTNILNKKLKNQCFEKFLENKREHPI